MTDASTSAAHQSVIEQIAPDFRLLDVWPLPIRGGRDDFRQAVALMMAFDPANAESTVSRALFRIRFRLGEWFGWDDGAARPIPGCTETTLTARLPDDLRGSADSTAIAGSLQEAAGGFVPLYRTDDEWAAELSNATVHGVLHLAWIRDGGEHYRGQLSVYVKPRGRLGDAYLTFIGPFRHLIVYPALMRQIRRAWEARDVTRAVRP